MTTPPVTTEFPALPALSRLGLSFQLLALALMAGGMLVLGAVTAPLVFGQLPRASAAHVMGLIFRRYDIVLLVALGVLWLGEIVRSVTVSRQCLVRPGMAWMLRGILLLALTGTLLYAILHVNPQIARFQEAGLHRSALTAEGLQFESVHRLSESLYKVDTLMALLVLVLTPFTLHHPVFCFLFNSMASRPSKTLEPSATVTGSLP